MAQKAGSFAQNNQFFHTIQILYKGIDCFFLIFMINKPAASPKTHLNLQENRYSRQLNRNMKKIH